MRDFSITVIFTIGNIFFFFLFKLVACVVLCIEARPAPQEGPFAALQRFVADFFGFSSTQPSQEKLHYEGNQPSDEHILNGLIGFHKFRQGLNNVQNQ